MTTYTADRAADTRAYVVAPASAETPVSRIAPRQEEVLRELATGATRFVVAHRLGISEHTVGRHMGDAFARLGVQNLIEAYVALGWLVVPDVAQR